MGRIELSGLYPTEDGFSIFLTRFHVTFQIDKNEDYIFYRLIVTDSNMEELVFNFYAVDDVFYFIEHVINKSQTKDQIINIYQQMFEEKRFKEPNKQKQKK